MHGWALECRDATAIELGWTDLVERVTRNGDDPRRAEAVAVAVAALRGAEAEAPRHGLGWPSGTGRTAGKVWCEARWGQRAAQEGNIKRQEPRKSVQET